MEGNVLSAERKEQYNPVPAITQEQWKLLLQTKKDFYTNKTSNLHNCPCLPPEVADSWFRSRKNQVDPNNPFSNSILSNSDMQNIIKQNNQIIRIATPLFKNFHKTRHCSEFHLHLIDKNGVLLLQEGLLFKDFANKTKTIFREENQGTNAHVICNLLKKPVMMLGPQHYNSFICKVIVIAAPIFDISGKILYNLIFSLPLTVLPWEKNYQEIYSPIYPLIGAMATSIEVELKHQKTHDYLKLMNEHLKVGTNSYDKKQENSEIITIDMMGRIVNTSSRLNDTTALGGNCFKNKNISEFVDDKLRLLNQISCGKDSSSNEIFYFDNKKCPSQLKIHPVKNHCAEIIIGAVLTLDMGTNTLNCLETKAKKTNDFSQLIGESPSFKKAVTFGQTFARSNNNILITGESGTGKELFAQAIHSSYRPHGPFIAINCAAMPRELIESELFGYERGSFTGADRCGRPGKIELANEGTLFLDEIGDMDLNLQAVLLRVLQDKQVVRVGGRHSKTINFRLIAATNKNLAERVEKHLFREDLFYRLSVLTIDLPPLRAREEDIPLLSRHFLKHHSKKQGIRELQIKTQAQEKLNAYKWPGNIRQLENAIIYAINFSQGGDSIGIRNLPENIILEECPNDQEETGTTISKPQNTIQSYEKNAIIHALADTQYNVIQAAKILGISKSTLYRKLKKYYILC